MLPVDDVIPVFKNMFDCVNLQIEEYPKVISLNFVQFLKAWLPICEHLGKFILVNLSQLKKALVERKVQLAKDILFKFEQLIKAPEPILKLFNPTKHTVSKLEQEAKAELPKFVIFSIVILDNLVL